MTRNTNK